MFTKLVIAVTPSFFGSFKTQRALVNALETDFTNVAALVCGPEDKDVVARCEATRFHIPIFVCDGAVDTEALETAAKRYEESLYPPFFGMLASYSKRGNDQLDCPGHQSGAFFCRHPAGRLFFDFFGPNLFAADLNNGDVALGDLLIHEGPPLAAQKAAAKIFNADKTYFVLNGTSASNKIAIGAVVTAGDLVLFDRNNHKSVHQGVQMTGAVPVYVETARNGYGFIGGIDEHCFDEAYLRAKVAKIDPERAKSPRPFRLAVIQLGTYDGTVYNARYVIDRIGHLCDYILFDSAWVGYEQFIPMMRDCSPLLLQLKTDDPGILVTQSVHKQLAGFSMVSQVHKKDAHIKDQARYVPHKRMNSSFLFQSSTSPFYPMFAALDVNAKMHEGDAAEIFWHACVIEGINARKAILKRCSKIRPFINPTIDGKPWESFDSETIASDIRFFAFDPKDAWHGFKGYGQNQYFVDPCKLLLTTPGVNPETGAYEDEGIPANVLAAFLRTRNIIPEKCDLNSLLILITPAESETKLARLVDALVEFEDLIDRDAPLEEVLPEVLAAYPERYRGYSVKALCADIFALYKKHDMKRLLQEMFREESLPRVAMLAHEAQLKFFRGETEYVALKDAQGRIAAEGALPYPPGVFCCVAGEVWSGAALKYFLAIEDAVNATPGFRPEVQGVYFEKEANGSLRLYANVIKA